MPNITSTKASSFSEIFGEPSRTGGSRVTEFDMFSPLTVGKNDTGHDVKFYGATSGKYLLWDESADKLIVYGGVEVGVDDTGHDVKFFGASTGKYMLWDESADSLIISGTLAPAATGGSDLGSTSAELGDIFVGDSKSLKFGADQDVALTHDGTSSLNLTVTDNMAAAFDIKESTNSYLKVVTSNLLERVVVGKPLDMTKGRDVETYVEVFDDFLRAAIDEASSPWILTKGSDGEAADAAIYTLKGTTLRTHDLRAQWWELFDTCVSNTGTMETHHALKRAQLGLPATYDPFSPEEVSTLVAKTKGSMQFEDSLVVCRFTAASQFELLCKILNEVTGWDFTLEKAMETGRRVVNLLKVFNLRHGIGSELDAPSVRLASIPTDGPAKGKSIMPFWKQMVRNYYEHMGWDGETGKPLPETLKNLGLEYTIPHIYREK